MYHTTKKRWVRFFQALSLLLCVFLGFTTACAAPLNSVASGNTSAQTDVQNAEHLLDKKGVPTLDIEGVGKVYHPAWIATYALEYAGKESFYGDNIEVEPSESALVSCAQWLMENAQLTPENYTVWNYTFDSTYNEVSVKAPWYSAFGQAMGIEALLAYYETAHDAKALEIAEKSAKVLFAPLSAKGLLFEEGNFLWFEEIPAEKNPSHILNGHMRALIALQTLYEATQNELYQDWFEKGSESLAEALPLFDTGYWLDYDLARKSTDILFRFANPYGYALAETPIDKITLTDPETGDEVVLDVGAQGDGSEEGKARIAGVDWQAEEEMDGRTIRRLFPEQTDQENGAPHSYFYLSLPSGWTNNLRSRPFEIAVTYKDEMPANTRVEIRSLAPGQEFRPLAGGELLQTGSGEWKDWKMELPVQDLGFWVGELYGQKHMMYLEWLAEFAPALAEWVSVARGYYNAVALPKDYQVVAAKFKPLPVNYTISAIGVSSHNVITQIMAGDADGLSDTLGEVYVNPYLVALQMTGDLPLNIYLDLNSTVEQTGIDTKGNSFLNKHNQVLLTPESAYEWAAENGILTENSVVWRYDGYNSYNDLEQLPPWQSAFSQAYVMDALAEYGDITLATKAAYAYGVDTSEGGVSSIAKDGTVWFEEVPNNSHILNAHIASVRSLLTLGEETDDPRIKAFAQAGLNSLLVKLAEYDTGYWSAYDKNPVKNKLFQLDWVSGEKSPLIESITLYDPQQNTAVVNPTGTEGAADPNTGIAGNQWEQPQLVDDIWVRGFTNGDKDNADMLPDGNQHGVYFRTVLPEQEFSDMFDVPTYKLMIRYKDVAEGTFSIKSQDISSGAALNFAPIANGLLRCTGDDQWKTAVFDVTPQDIAWYMGVDYQKYHVEQLEAVAEITQDWRIEQMAERWQYYVDGFENEQPIIIEPSSIPASELSRAA